jgi:hypothetical protein
LAIESSLLRDRFSCHIGVSALPRKKHLRISERVQTIRHILLFEQKEVSGFRESCDDSCAATRTKYRSQERQIMFAKCKRELAAWAVETRIAGSQPVATAEVIRCLVSRPLARAPGCAQSVAIPRLVARISSGVRLRATIEHYTEKWWEASRQSDRVVGRRLQDWKQPMSADRLASLRPSNKDGWQATSLSPSQRRLLQAHTRPARTCWEGELHDGGSCGRNAYWKGIGIRPLSQDALSRQALFRSRVRSDSRIDGADIARYNPAPANCQS